jgi:FMN phosphatase YigB (HAD superfamily)
MTASASTRPVFVLDVDNTLLDNDALKADIDRRLRALVGDAAAARFWQIYEDVRMASDVVNYPLALEVFADELRDAELARKLHELVMDDDFPRYVYPDAFPTLAHLRTLGLPVIVSDGDSVYQPLKIERSGLAAAVNGEVLVFIHKEAHLEEIMARWPSDLYVMVDDKANILAETKRRFPDRFVTIHVRQGHYGQDPQRYSPAPDIEVHRIGDLRTLTLDELTRHRGR